MFCNESEQYLLVDGMKKISKQLSRSQAQQKVNQKIMKTFNKCVLKVHIAYKNKFSKISFFSSLVLLFMLLLNASCYYFISMHFYYLHRVIKAELRIGISQNKPQTCQDTVDQKKVPHTGCNLIVVWL